MKAIHKHLFAFVLLVIFGTTCLHAASDVKSLPQQGENHSKALTEEQALVKSARNAMSCGNWDEAINPLQQLVAKHKRWEYYESLGYVQSKLGRYDDALESYTIARELIKGKKPALNASYSKQKQAGLARIFFNEGYLYMKLSNYKKPGSPCEDEPDNNHAAACYYEQARKNLVEIDSTRSDVVETLAYTHFALAEVYEARKDAKDSDLEYGEALATYKQLLPNGGGLPLGESGSDADRIRWNEWMISLKLHKEVGQVPYFPNQYPSCKSNQKMISIR